MVKKKRKGQGRGQGEQYQPEDQEQQKSQQREGCQQQGESSSVGRGRGRSQQQGGADNSEGSSSQQGTEERVEQVPVRDHQQIGGRGRGSSSQLGCEDGAGRGIGRGHQLGGDHAGRGISKGSDPAGKEKAGREIGRGRQQGEGDHAGRGISKGSDPAGEEKAGRGIGRGRQQGEGDHAGRGISKDSDPAGEEKAGKGIGRGRQQGEGDHAGRGISKGSDPAGEEKAGRGIGRGRQQGEGDHAGRGISKGSDTAGEDRAGKDQGSASVAKMTSSMSKVAISAPSVGGPWKIPHRKKEADKSGRVGVRGRPILIEVNHLLISLKKQRLVIHYDCIFKPELPKKFLRFAMEKMRLKNFPNRYPAFDGVKNLYSSGELPFGHTIRDSVTVSEDDREIEYDITIKRVSTVDMNQIVEYMKRDVAFPQDAIQALDVALRNPSSLRFTPVGRCFFTRPRQNIISLGNGLELWEGYYQSATIGWLPFLNVDVAHKGFPEPKWLLDVMMDMQGKYCRRNDPRPSLQLLAKEGIKGSPLEDFVKFIKGLKVMYEIPGQPQTKRGYKVLAVGKSALEIRFTLEEKGAEKNDSKRTGQKTMTVGEYYAKEKRYPLRYPHLPCIRVGNPKKEIYVPAELCTICEGQVITRKMDSTQTAAMVKAAATPTDVRKRKIMEKVNILDYNNDPCLREFGVTINPNFQQIGARVLNPLRVQYGENKSVLVSKGVWRPLKFISPVRLERWAIITLSTFNPSDSPLRNLAKTLSQVGQLFGMQISEPYRYVLLANEVRQNFSQGEQLRKVLFPYFQGFKNEGAQLVLVVITDRPPNSYSKVKLVAENEVGLLTQCLKESTLNKKSVGPPGCLDQATAGNLLLKINAKLNGVNHTVDRSLCPVIMDVPTMLVGADVTHPSPDQTTIPSVAAVAASHDRRAFHYNMIFKLQPPREEIIVDLEKIMKEQLKYFYKKTNQKPVKVIFYRDGVSEGQFSEVLYRELSAIRRACSSLHADYKPTVTFLVVQKRHHTRFFPVKKEDEDGTRNRNVPPGTIVDTQITHPREMDFYLVSHASIQGTSRPTKYHILWDENKIDEDDLEELTYYLCHLFSRCNRSVSYPAPTYYAHLAAARGRVYLDGHQVNLTNLEQEMKNIMVQESIVVDSPMYFI